MPTMTNMCKMIGNVPMCMSSHADFCVDHGVMFVVANTSLYKKCYFFSEDEWGKCCFRENYKPTDAISSQHTYPCKNPAAIKDCRLDEKMEEI